MPAPLQRRGRAAFAGCDARAASGVASAPALRDLWRGPLSAEAARLQAVPAAPGGPLETASSSSALRSRLESAHHWEMQRIFGDPMAATPPSAKHLFISCGVIEGIFLCVNICTMSPLAFEMCMPYHLKYTGLIIGWWGGTYLGLNIARYGPLSEGVWFSARMLAGPLFVTLGVLGLVLADGVPGAPNLGPWPSYWLLIGSFVGMSGFDVALHRHRMLPPWLLKWKLGISGLIVCSLLLGVVKGQYLERNATQLIMAEGYSDDEL